jgi:hypothetical protein
MSVFFFEIPDCVGASLDAADVALMATAPYAWIVSVDA